MDWNATSLFNLNNSLLQAPPLSGVYISKHTAMNFRISPPSSSSAESHLNVYYLLNFLFHNSAQIVCLCVALYWVDLRLKSILSMNRRKTDTAPPPQRLVILLRLLSYRNRMSSFAAFDLTATSDSPCWTINKCATTKSFSLHNKLVTNCWRHAAWHPQPWHKSPSKILPTLLHQVQPHQLSIIHFHRTI